MSKIIHRWKNISLIEEDIALPNGNTISHTMIHHPGAAVILPVTESGNIILINQFRPSLKKWLLELPAGTIEPGEQPLECAKRELEEETGFSGEEFISLGLVTPLAGFCDEIQYLYVAKQLSETRRYACDDDEIIEVVTLSLDELEDKIRQESITDAKTIACLSKAKLCGYI
ncbi:MULTISPECIES: NUDIX hydrolase [Vibrio]|uniref:GDP-mannose pyrophosphatase n=2 Tax=Vibrio TaxID=662 RepID=A0A1E5D3B6_9VIBR|nr:MULTISPECIES: NUDIX hydrolase [Vibrio]RBW65025.1 NUDIX hydrolase [Vibrionales bacterium C3R12]MDN3696250.1 NUDIX hydrolase [Vibrio cortegadensis]NOH85421.1 NUDIX hydrolase [Vibrio sp. 03-59-1]OEE78043.1 ADP-ribose pyrophosphatase [Vibrio genomosp. F6 str. FF-238]TKF18961.1 NUDIX hydrolase [Vibrio genomosp. F6]